MNTNLYENKSGHNEHIYFNIKLYENKSGHYCNLLKKNDHYFKELTKLTKGIYGNPVRVQ
jgi:hypothetical protein